MSIGRRGHDRQTGCRFSFTAEEWGKEGRREEDILPTLREGRWGHCGDTIPHLPLSLCPLRLSNTHFNFHHPGCSSHLCDLFLTPLPLLSPSTPLSSPLPSPPSNPHAFLSYLHHPSTPSPRRQASLSVSSWPSVFKIVGARAFHWAGSTSMQKHVCL